MLQLGMLLIFLILSIQNQHLQIVTLDLNCFSYISNAFAQQQVKETKLLSV